MYNISNEFKQKFIGDSVRKVITINFEDDGMLPVSNSNILQESMKLTEILCDEEQIKFGLCNASMFEIQCAGLTADIVGKEIKPTISIDNNVLPLGTFIIESAKRVVGTKFRKIVAYDKIKWFEYDVTDWYNSLKFPMSLKQFRNALFSHIGIDQEIITLPFDDFIVDYTTNQKVQGIQLLQSLCEINGCFGRMNRDGKFQYVFLQASALYPSEFLYPDESLYPFDGNAINITQDGSKLIIGRPTCEEYSTENISGVGVYDDEETFYLSGSSENAYIIQNNMFLLGLGSSELEHVTTKVNSIINGISYRPFEANIKGQPYIECGDNILISSNGDSIDTYVFKRILTGIQALKDNYSSQGDQFLYYDNNSISQQITNLNNSNRRTIKRIAETEKGLSLKVSKGDVSSEISQESDTITIRGNRFILEADNISIDEYGKLKAKDAEFEGMVKSKFGNIGGFNITDTGIQSVYRAGWDDIERLIQINSTNNPYNDYPIFFGKADSTGENFDFVFGIDNNGQIFGNAGAQIHGNLWAWDSFLAQKDAFIDGDLFVYGSKNRVVRTDNYGDRLLNAIESPDALFSDFGSGEITSNGTTVIYFDKIFSETINLDYGYKVFLTRTSEKQTSWVEKKKDCFVVHGENGATFDWQVVCKQKGFEEARLEKCVTSNNKEE